MSLNLDEQEFIEKYGFSLNDLYYACIYDICRKPYWCCSVKEMAYSIENKIYQELRENNVESNILYKLTHDKFFSIQIYTHNIAIPYKDIYFTFEIGWVGNSLNVKDWDINPKEEIENDKKYENIEDVLAEEEEESASEYK